MPRAQDDRPRYRHPLPEKLHVLQTADLPPDECRRSKKVSGKHQQADSDDAPQKPAAAGARIEMHEEHLSDEAFDTGLRWLLAGLRASRDQAP